MGWGWGCFNWNMYTSHLFITYGNIYTLKLQMYLEMIGKIVYYQILAPFQNQVMHSITSFKCFANIIGSIVLFKRLQAGRQYYNFSTTEWNLIKWIHVHVYETPLVCAWAMALRWPIRPIGLLIWVFKMSKLFHYCKFIFMLISLYLFLPKLLYIW